MPKPFHQLSLEEFIDLLTRFPFTRRINAVHMHHTWRPNHSQYKGLASIEAMWSFHTQQQGWSDIAQHITVAPDGTIWTGRDWNQPPASAKGFNGNEHAGPFMFEMIGDFDVGKDRFEGCQRKTALQVIAHVQERFTLPVEALRFHNEMSAKSCPGSSLQRQDIIEAVRQLRANLTIERSAPRARNLPFGEEALAVRGKTEEVLRSLTSRNGVTVTDSLGAELSEATMSEAEVAALAGAESFIESTPTGRRDGVRAAELTPELLASLRPHVINLTQGQFSSDGLFSTTPSDVDTIFGEHLERALTAEKADGRKLRIMCYAHGGLVSEEDGLRIAAKHVEWWKKNHVYPIYFIWETGLFETIGQLLFGARGRARDLGARDFQDYTTDPVIEALVRTGGGTHIWSGMKRNAELAVADDGGARYAARKLKAFCDAHGGEVELHAIGHSAGSIFHAHFLPTALALQVPAFDSLQLLAPAIRIDEFHKRLAVHVGAGITTLNMFTMAKDWEKDDHCARVYGKSLLYLIYYALEPEKKTPILGLEESVRADPRLQQLFGLVGNSVKHGEVIWAKTKVKTGRHASTSTSHGGFDDDPPTMNSVVRRILNVGDTEAIADFAEEVKDSRSLTTWKVSGAPAEPFLTPPSFGNGQPHGLPARTSTLGATLPPTVWANNGGNRGGRRRRALCVGINRYQNAPLYGCVADAEEWARTLVQLGFEQPLLLRDEQATRSAIVDTLKNLIASSGSGDVVVFQYAGHGTQLPDLDGDEVDGDTPDKDEALCPIDYGFGAFVIDDDLAEIFRNIPAGVNVTCFFDCCHSGTNTRLAVGGSLRAQGATPDQRPRFLVATEEMKKAHSRFRERLSRSRAINSRGPDSMRQVVFSACRSSEVAWESGGHGDFTVQATALLRAGIDGVSHEEFKRRVITAFGSTPRQHPELDCASEANARGLLQPLAGLVEAATPPTTQLSSGSAAGGDALSRLVALTQQLYSVVQTLRR